MPSLYSALDIARTALLTDEQSINVTSQNIANANTPGYSRQVANLTENTPVEYGGVFYGTGVDVQNVTRSYDNFVSTQLMSSNSSLSAFQSESSVLNNIQTYFNDQSGSGLNSDINGFFSSFQDLANDPSSSASRSAVLSSANTLADGFNNIDSAIKQNLSDINQQISASVQQINGLANQIAGLNQAVANAQSGGTSANDLLDQRDVLLGQLSNIVDVKTIEDQSGELNVYVGGTCLVTGSQVSPLTVSANGGAGADNIESNGVSINSNISGGSLKGILNASQYIQGLDGNLNLMAFSLTKSVDLQHRSGYGLDGSTNTDFFSLPTVYAGANSGNTGGATVSGASIANLSAVTSDNYEIRFSSASSYTVVDTTTGSVVVPNGAYTSGNAINFDGLSVAVANNSGPPAAGDAFSVNLTTNAAQNLSVAISDPSKIAAASTSAGLPGDNTNALALASLNNASIVNGATLGDYYSSAVTDLGSTVQNVSNSVTAQQNVTNQLQASKDSVSKVSIEEEAVNLIKLQQAYQASAKVISTVNNMMDALMNMQ